MNSVWVRFGESIIGFLGFSRDKDGDDGCAVAGLVKIFEIKAVVPGLIEVGTLVAPLTDFEFDGKNNLGRDQNGVDAATDAGDVELEVNESGQTGEALLQNGYLNLPSVALLNLERELAV